jgi:hypothetical protein
MATAPIVPPPLDRKNTWTFRDGETVLYVETPQNLSPKMWEMLERFVQVIKPAD